LIRIRLTDLDELRELPDGVVLTSESTGERMVWVRAYLRPHPDPVTGLWTLPRNPFTEWQVPEIEAELPDIIDSAALTGYEPWLSTLDDPHDTTPQH
jgi:hypothetical protein